MPKSKKISRNNCRDGRNVRLFCFVHTLLKDATKKLKNVSETAQLDAELLLAHVLNITRTQLLTHTDYPVQPAQQYRFNQLLSKRQQGWPIAYLLGYREFWSMRLHVTPATLIPRPETELLVEVILKKFSANTSLTIADLGTGCGAIALALGKEHPAWSIVATDKNLDALAVAKQNAKMLAITNVTFRAGDWCDALDGLHFDVIVSNPPYISKGDPHLKQGDLRFEPSSALVSAGQGLADLERIIATVRNNLSPEGWLFVEHGHDQSERVKEIFLRCNYQKIINYTDFIGLKRVVCGKL